MAANAKLRKALFDKLGLSQSGFSRRVKRFKKQLPMNYEDAIYVLAHQNGIDISRELDSKTLARVAGYVAQLSGPTSATRKSSQSPQQPAKQTFAIAGIDVGKIPGMTEAHAKDARIMAKKVFPVLYAFENSARDVITHVLKGALGNDWWDYVPLEVRNQADFNKKKESEEPWHSKRAAPIQFVDLPQLKNIINDPALWPYFKSLFTRQTWFDSVVDDMNVSRRVAAHMNPLSDDDIKSMETGFRKWVKQLQAKEAELP
jgi:hypothetical protein